jgi:hypothetical protein
VQDVIFVLGAADPEMRAIEELLTTHGVPCARAMVDGKRVYPANAYDAELPPAAAAVRARGGRVYLVECVGHVPPGAVRIDHHHAGDPGFGRPPREYWEASSVGQTVAVLADGIVDGVAATPALRLVAAADHCLGAAYRGECPDVEPGALMRWHVTSRALFEKRSETALLRDVDAARQALREATRVELAPGVFAADLRDRFVPELLLAAARDGQCCLSAVMTRDGRTKVGCLVGTPAQVSAFIDSWVPAHQLVDVYGDSARGFAGAYRPRG